MQTTLVPQVLRRRTTLWEAQSRGNARQQDTGRVQGSGCGVHAADLGGDVLQDRDGLLVVGHEETYFPHAVQGTSFAVLLDMEGMNRLCGEKNSLSRRQLRLGWHFLR